MTRKTHGLFLVPVLLFFSFTLGVSGDCDRVKVEAEVTHTTNSDDNGSINLSIEGASNKYKIHVIGDSPEKNQLNLKGNRISNLPSGVYDIVLQDPAGCTKAIKVNVN